MSQTAAAWAPGVGALGLGAVIPVALLIPATHHGGLAPLATAVVVALLVGVPAAVAEWRLPPRADPGWRTATSSVADLVALGAIAATAGHWVASAGWFGWLAIPLGWAAAWLLHRSAVWVAAPMVVATGVLWIQGALSLAFGPSPFTLLTPGWAWQDAHLWLGPALLAGVWLGGAGMGQWSTGARRKPGRDGGPWASSGAAILLLVGLVTCNAAIYEQTLGLTTASLPSSLAVAMVLVSAAATVLGRRSDPGAHHVGPKVVRWRALGGMLLTAWAAGPASGSVDFALATVLPMGMLLLLVLVAEVEQGPARTAAAFAVAILVVFTAGPGVLGWSDPIVLTVGGAVTMAGCLTLSASSAPVLAAATVVWAGLLLSMVAPPARTGDAAVAAATLAAAFWFVATRTVLARRSR